MRLIESCNCNPQYHVAESRDRECRRKSRGEKTRITSAIGKNNRCSANAGGRHCETNGGKNGLQTAKKTAKCIIIKLYSREKSKQCGFMQKQAK